MSDKPIAEFVGRIAAAVAMLTLVGGGYAVDKYLERKTSHDKLTTVHYDGEWSRGECRECVSLNSREEDVKPELICFRSLDFRLPDPFPVPIGRILSVSFSGDLTYDEEKPQSEAHHWRCYRNVVDVTLSCSARPQAGGGQPPKPVEEPQLTHDEVESLRKRNECEQRFYDNKIYKIGGVRVIPACKQNPERRPRLRHGR